MGWIIFAVYLFFAILYHIFNHVEESAPEGSAEKKIAKIVKYCAIGIIGLGLLILILYVIGWVWYFFCGGFLVFEDCPFWDKVIYGLISLVLLGFFFGFVMVCFGWDPDNRR